MSSGITHMDRNKLQKKSRSLMLGTEGFDNTCFRIHIYKHRKHGNLHVSKKKKAYQCTSISLQRHAVKVSNLLDGFKRLLVQHSFRKRNVSHQFHLHTRFFNHNESRFWRDLRNLQNHACSHTAPRVWRPNLYFVHMSS